MISDARALRPEFVPRDMVHRDGAIDHMAAVLNPVGASENVALFGPSGSGKTTLAKFVLGKLEVETLDYRWGYHDCMGESSKAGALHQLVRDAGLARDLRRSGTPIGEYLDRIRAVDGSLAVVLDEVDVLDDASLITTLADLPDVSLVTICIDQDQLHTSLRTDERVRSRLRSAETIHLDRYSHEELVDIIQYRVEHGLDSSRVDDAAIAEIADIAAGDAREALAYLRRGARHVQQGQADRLTVDVVVEVADQARDDLRARRIRYLGTHKRALYEVIRDAGPDGVRAGELHERYEQRVQEPKTRRTRRRYLDRLQEYELIESGGEKSGRRYVAL